MGHEKRIRSAVTISLVQQVKEGPFVFTDGLERGCRCAADMGFDAIELFAPPTMLPDAEEMAELLARQRLSLAAVGTGAGYVLNGLSLLDVDPQVRESAEAMIAGVIDWAGRLGAPSMVGSMKGSIPGGTNEATARSWLAPSLARLSERAARHGQVLLLEPLNRYETNFLHTIEQGASFIEEHKLRNVKLLADFFHMAIEEESMVKPLIEFGGHIGHVHFADSNRRAPGFGHTDWAEICGALLGCGYRGYVSAEILAYPDDVGAARQTLTAFGEYIEHRTAA